MIQIFHLSIDLEILGLQSVQLFLLLVNDIGILILELDVICLFLLKQVLNIENFFARIVRIFVHRGFKLVALFNMLVELFSHFRYLCASLVASILHLIALLNKVVVFVHQFIVLFVELVELLLQKNFLLKRHHLLS